MANGVKGMKWIKSEKTPGVKAKEIMADYKKDVILMKELQNQIMNDESGDNTDTIDTCYEITEGLSIKTVELMEACVNLLSELEADQRVMHERLRAIENKLEEKE